MKKIENECVGCRDIGLPCIGTSCPNLSVTRYYCDECGDETVLYEYEGQQLCETCLLQKFDVVEGSDR